MDSMKLDQVRWHLLDRQTTSDDLLAEAIDAHMDQHVAMVAKLRELEDWCFDGGTSSPDWNTCSKDIGHRLHNILSAQPADPVNVDVQALRNVIKEMRDVATFNHATADDFKNRWVDELDKAIGDRT